MATSTFPELAGVESIQPVQQMQRIAELAQAQQQTAQQAQLFPDVLAQQRLATQQAQNQLAIQNQQVRDITAGQQAYAEWNPSDGYNALASLMIKHGASVGAANQVALYSLDRQAKLADIILKQGEAGKNHVESLGKNNDIAAGKVDYLMGLPDAQLQQGVLDTAQQGQQQGWMDPSHYQAALRLAQQSPAAIRQQLPNIKKEYMSESLQAETALKHAEELEASQRGQLEAQMMQAGGTPELQDARYTSLKALQAKGQPLRPDDVAFMKGYEQRKLLVPTTVAQIRLEGMGQLREYLVINSQTGALEYRNASEINAANAGGRSVYAPAGPGAAAMSKEAIFSDLHYNINNARQAISALDNMDAGTRAQIGIALRQTDPKSALSTFLTSAAGTQLSDAQQNAVIALASLAENAMALRSVAGLGQGSDEMRSAILATVPSGKTPSKGYAMKQLDQFEGIVSRLEKGVPKVGAGITAAPSAAGGGAPGASAAGAIAAPPAAGYTRIRDSNGNLHDIPTGNLPGARKIDPGLQVVQ